MHSQRTTPRPAFRRLYSVAGRFLCVETLDEWSATIVERYDRNWCLDPVPLPSAASPNATIRVGRVGPAPPLPKGLDTFRLGEGWLCHTDGRSYHLDIEGSRVLIGDAASREVEVWVSPNAEAGSAALAQTVFNAFSAVMRRCGLFELHSAGVVEPEGGAGALLVGVSGSGKSTLTMQLAASGWGYLSDDVLLLGECDGRIEAQPLRKVFAATEQTVAAAGFDAGATVVLPQSNDKLRFAPQVFFSEGHVESSFARVLFFPAVTREESSRVGELTQAEALTRLLRMCPWASYDRPTSAAYLRVLALLAKQCRAYEVRAGRDLLASPARAAALLAPHARL